MIQRSEFFSCVQSIGGVLFVLAGAMAALAAERSFVLVIDAGMSDRRDVPVCVPIEAGAAQAVELTDGSGRRIAAQLTATGLSASSIPSTTGEAAPSNRRELHFILPGLAQGAKLELRATLRDEAGPRQTGDEPFFAWVHEASRFAELRLGRRPVLRYMCEPLDAARREETYKVYHHLYDPAGTMLVTKGPGGLYPHHRGLFYGFRRVTYPGGVCDIWGCGGGAYQSHEGFLAEEAGAVVGRHRVAVDWHGTAGHVFAKEQRELTTYATPGGTLVEFVSRLETTGGKVRLDGDPQHAGFHFRAAQAVADGDQKLTYYLRPDGKGSPGETRNWTKDHPEHADLPWNAMSFVIEGRRFTALYIDHPANPKPARYSERTYGRFGSYFAYELDEQHPLVARYRIWLQEGEMTAERCAALAADFVDPPKVAVD